MQIGRWLQTGASQLTTNGITSARLDCLILLEDELSRDRSWLLAHNEFELSDTQLIALNTKLSRREKHEPLAYIRGHSEFYGRTFQVNHSVLEPRPETEDIITLLKDLSLPAQPVVVDVGTGSGCLAITAKLELPHIMAYGFDIDTACLAVARSNAEALKADVIFAQSDLLEPRDSAILPAPDVIIANLPYVPDDLRINQAAGHEPGLAIFGGPDGLELFRQMFDQIQKMQHRPTSIITEALPSTHNELAILANEKGYGLVTVAGFVQLFSRA